MPESRKISFAGFEVRPDTGEIYKNGRKLKLQSQPFELLMLLLECPNELVTREKIRERLWSADTFVDFDHSLGTAINKIRAVLDDSADSPRFIETLPKRGYRFIGKATRSPAEAENAAAAPDPAADRAVRLDPSGTETPSRLYRRLAAAAGLMAVFLAAAAYARRGAEPHGASATPAIHSLAVLPLDNLSNNPDEEYFAEGMTDELITSLAKYRSLRVVSRTSIMQYKKARRPLPEIARELGVDAIVEGSILRSQNRVRITAQLVYAPTDTHLWAESYDRAVNDALSLHQEVADGIAAHIGLATPPHPPTNVVRASVSPAAREAYLRGRYLWSSSQYEKSRSFFQEAIRLDPGYAPGYSGLADSYTAAAVEGQLPTFKAMPLAESAAKKALELDESLPEGHHAMCAVELFFHWNWDDAERQCRSAIELSPSFAESHHLRAYALVALNRTDESLQEDKLTLELDAFARPWVYGYGLLHAGRYDEAIQEFLLRCEARRDSAILHGFLADAYAAKGDEAHSFAERRTVAEIEKQTDDLARIERAFRKGGLRQLNLENLSEMKQNAAHAYVSSELMAELAAGAGLPEEALRYLEQAYQQRDPQMIYLQHNPKLNSLHSELAFQAIAAKMNLPPMPAVALTR